MSGWLCNAFPCQIVNLATSKFAQNVAQMQIAGYIGWEERPLQSVHWCAPWIQGWKKQPGRKTTMWPDRQKKCPPCWRHEGWSIEAMTALKKIEEGGWRWPSSITNYHQKTYHKSELSLEGDLSPVTELERAMRIASLWQLRSNLHNFKICN